MRIHRLKTLILHSYYHLTHSKETWIDLVWFTSIQFISFGFLSRIIGNANGNIGQYLMLGFLFWELVRIGQYCVTVSMLWEVWSRSLSTMFISPLTMSEWIFGQIIAGFIKTILIIGMLGALSAFLFNFSLMTLFPGLILYILILLSFSFATGIFLTGLILRYGTDLQSLAWGMIFILQPISAVFYPVDALPVQVRCLAFLSPITYIMESARYQLQTGNMLGNYILISILLTFAYLLISLYFLRIMFHWSKQTGAFARLGN